MVIRVPTQISGKAQQIARRKLRFLYLKEFKDIRYEIWRKLPYGLKRGKQAYDRALSALVRKHLKEYQTYYGEAREELLSKLEE